MDGAFGTPRVTAADPIERIAEAAKRLGLNVWTLRSRAASLGLTSGLPVGRPKKGEVAGLRRSEWNRCGGAWPRGSAARKVPRPSPVPGKKPRWTTADKETLALQWGVLPPAELEALLGRTWRAIIDQAVRQGLPTGLPRGWRSITGAAKALGMSRPSLLRVLARNGVEVRLHPCPLNHPSCRERLAKRTGRRSDRRCVDYFLAREAVAQETRETEVVRAAAFARGLVHETLRAWLREAGELLPASESRKGSPVRVRTEIIDRVVNTRRAAGVGRRERE